MKFQFELSEEELRSLVIAYIQNSILHDNVPLKTEDVLIEVKSKQNYRSEWEEAKFRARVNISR